MKKSIILLVALTTIFGCGEQENKSTPNTQAMLNSSVVTPDLIVAVGKVEPENKIVDISAPAGGIIKTVFKNDGDQVMQGELLVQLDDDVEQSKVNEIKMQLQSQRSQIEVEKTVWKETQVNLENKRLLLAKTERLLKSGAETRQTFDDLMTDIKILKVNAERSQARIQLAKNRLNELLAQLKTAETEAEKKQFKAHFDGVVLDMQVSQGGAINQFATFAEFAPKGNLIIRAEVDELFSSKIQVGQKAEITLTGSDKIIAVGEIKSVGPYLKKKSLFSEKAGDQEDRRVREISIALKDAGNLIINAKVECKIKL